MREIVTDLNSPALRKGSFSENCFGCGPVRHIDDEDAAGARGIVVTGEQRAAQDQDILMLPEIGEMRITRGRPDGCAVGTIFLVDDVEHGGFRRLLGLPAQQKLRIDLD